MAVLVGPYEMLVYLPRAEVATFYPGARWLTLPAPRLAALFPELAWGWVLRATCAGRPELLDALARGEVAPLAALYPPEAQVWVLALRLPPDQEEDAEYFPGMAVVELSDSLLTPANALTPAARVRIGRAGTLVRWRWLPTAPARRALVAGPPVDRCVLWGADRRLQAYSGQPAIPAGAPAIPEVPAPARGLWATVRRVFGRA